MADGGYVVTYYGYENDSTAGTNGLIAKRFDAAGSQTASIVVATGNVLGYVGDGALQRRLCRGMEPLH